MPRWKTENNDVLGVKTDTRMTEEICNTSCYQIRSTNNHLCQNEETSYVNCFHLQTTNFIIIDANLLTSPEFATITHTYIADLQPKNPIYVPQHLLTYLCSYTDLYSMPTNLSKLTTSRKLVIKVTETPFVIMSRKQLFMNHVSCLMLIIREPHFQLILISTFTRVFTAIIGHINSIPFIYSKLHT